MHTLRILVLLAVLACAVSAFSLKDLAKESVKDIDGSKQKKHRVVEEILPEEFSTDSAASEVEPDGEDESQLEVVQPEEEDDDDEIHQLITSDEPEPEPETQIQEIVQKPVGTDPFKCKLFNGYHVAKNGQIFKIPRESGTHRLAKWTSSKQENEVQIYFDGINGMTDKIAVKRGDNTVIVTKNRRTGNVQVWINCKVHKGSFTVQLTDTMTVIREKVQVKVILGTDEIWIDAIKPLWFTTTIKLCPKSHAKLSDSWCYGSESIKNKETVQLLDDLFKDCLVKESDSLDIQCDERIACKEGSKACVDAFQKTVGNYECKKSKYRQYLKKCILDYCSNFRYMNATVIVNTAVLAWEDAMDLSLDCEPVRKTTLPVATTTVVTTKVETTKPVGTTTVGTTKPGVTTPVSTTPTGGNTTRPVATTPVATTPVATTPVATTPQVLIGCDGLVNSTACFDDCGVCGGDGKSCHTKPKKTTPPVVGTTKPGVTTTTVGTTKPGVTTTTVGTTKPGVTTTTVGTTKPGVTTTTVGTTKPGVTTTTVGTTKPGVTTTTVGTTKPGVTTPPVVTPKVETTKPVITTKTEKTNPPEKLEKITFTPPAQTQNLTNGTCPEALLDACNVCKGNGTTCGPTSCLASNSTCLAFGSFIATCERGLNFDCLGTEIKNQTCLKEACKGGKCNYTTPCLVNQCIPRQCLKNQSFVNDKCFNTTTLCAPGTNVGVIAGTGAAAAGAVAAGFAAYTSFVTPPTEAPLLTPDFGNQLVDNNPLFVPQNVWGESQLFSAPGL